MVAAGLHVDCGSGALVHDDILYRRTRLQRFFDGGKKFDFCAAAIGAILSDDRGRLRVVDAIDEGVGGKSAEDDGVRRADAGAGEHRNRQLRRHAHVEGDAVAFFNSERLQDVGEFLYFAMQLLIGNGADFAGFALPDDGGFVLARCPHVAVEAIVGKIEFRRR